MKPEGDGGSAANTRSRRLLVALLCIGMPGAASASAGTYSCGASQPIPASLDRLLDAQGVEPTDRLVALADLDGDGRRDALVYLHGSDWCGSGGCTLLVLRNLGKTWRQVSRITVTRPPIRLLDQRHKGWHALTVHVAGGGSSPQDVTLEFDGHRYPGNPTTLQTTPTMIGPGRVLIDAGPDGSPRCGR